MSIDVILKAIGTLVCIYTVGLFVSVMSTAALNAAGATAGSPCGDRACRMAATQAAPMPEPTLVHSVIMFAGSL